MKALRTDLASFSGAGYGSVFIPSGIEVTAGEIVLITDDEADAVEAEILAITDDVARVKARWDQPAIPVFDLELSPVNRRTGVAYLHDVYLDADDQVAPGDRVLVRDEGGEFWVAEVGPREEVRLGHRYSLTLRPTT